MKELLQDVLLENIKSKLPEIANLLEIANSKN